jgi:hypothetical protein
VVVGPSHETAVTEELPEYFAGRPQQSRPETVRLRDVLVSTGAGVRHLAVTLIEPGEGGHDLQKRPGFRSGMGPYETRRDRELSARFLRLVELPGRHLEAMLSEWWAGALKDRTGRRRVVVRRRFELGPPCVDACGGWTMRGHMRRPIGLHWLPVVVELWSHLDDWTMMTMTPQSRVICSGRYFRTGNAALDRLTGALAATAHTSPSLSN